MSSGAMEYSELKKQGKALLAEGDIKSCLLLFEKALKITPDDERIQSKVDTLRKALEEEEAEQNEEEDDGETTPGTTANSEMRELCPGFYLHPKIYDKLFPYQKEGLKWMYGLFRRKRGGVLGDDMGLGKTVQVVSYLAGLFDMEAIKSVLLIMPVSLIGNWMSEFERWAPGISVHDYHSATKREKEISLKKVMNRGGVILTSYGMVTTRHEDLCVNGSRKFVWDYVILDEGHKIKNPTKTQSAVFSLLANHRLILTGTAVQNSLGELWSLYHFTHQGTLFGNKAGFRQDFENPINRGREKDATAGEREMGVQLARQLKEMISPFFLRRTKAEVFKNGNGPKIDSNKEDLVLWTYLSERQQDLYKDFLESEQVKDILMSSKSPLVQLNILKKICDHPRLLPKKACVQLGMCDGMTEEQIREFLEDDRFCPFTIDDVSDETLLAESGKMKLVIDLMEKLKTGGHRTLIFSTSRRILDMIQRILRSRKFSVTRLDGTVSKNSERKRIVDEFQTRGQDVFLLTTQVGGVGLTLTNADRVIIYDPNWNPATDAQAVDRVFRIGQTRDVIVYRFITCGTVEEKIYARQIFKDSIIKQTTGNQKDPTRYFTRNQLRDLFVLTDPLQSETQMQLTTMHTKKISDELEEHIDFLISTKNVFGVSHHDLMFSTEEEDKENVPEQQRAFISHQVERARTLREKEAEIMSEDLKKNPYLVPVANFKTAASKNTAASMSSTVNPANLRDRSIPEGNFIDLSQEDEDDSDDEDYVQVVEEKPKSVKTEIIYNSEKNAKRSPPKVESYVIVDSDEEFDFKNEAANVKASLAKTEETSFVSTKSEVVDDDEGDIDEIVVVKKADTSIRSTTSRKSDSSLDDSFNFNRKRKPQRIYDSDSDSPMEEINPKDFLESTKITEQSVLEGAAGDFAPKSKKRRSVATFKRLSPPIIEDDSSNQSASGSANTSDPNERKRNIEEAAYDEAFEAADDFDESIIEKTILERSQDDGSDSNSFVVEDSSIEESSKSRIDDKSDDDFVVGSSDED